VEHYDCSFTLKLTKDDYSIGYLFGLMEEIKESFNISEYSVSQTSLEQIFNIFAREDVLRKKLASGEALLDKKLQ
jgi:ATP-binding cassette, subfamily A (ABC1), member 3